MTLRQELSLLFAGVFAVFVAVVMWLSYSALRGSFEDRVREKIDPEPVRQVASIDAERLVERSRTIVKNPLVNDYKRDVVFTEGAGDPVEALTQKLKQARVPGSDSHGQLATLYDQTLGLIESTAYTLRSNLVLLLSEEGHVIVEVIDRSSDQFAEDPNYSTHVERFDGMSDSRIMEAVLNEGEDSAGGFLVYPDDKLYLYGASWFLKRDIFEGAAILGVRVNRAYLQRIVDSDGEDQDFLVAVVYEHGVVGVNDDSETLGQELKDSFGAAVEPPRNWRSRDGRDFVVETAPLHLNFNHARLGTTGRIYLIHDVRDLKKQAAEEARSMLYTGLAVFGLTLLLIPVVTGRVTRPIIHLSEAMIAVGGGRLEELSFDQGAAQEVREAAASFNEMVVGLKQKKALEHFVPEGTIAELEATRGAAPELGGERLERTIMFSDLRGFTSMSERLPAKQVVEVLNRYLEVMSRAIREEGGDINEFIGDAILAVFESADASVRAARAMNTALLLLHEETDLPELKKLRQGIGLHTGDLVEGNIGERDGRLKRAVIGDTVNLAARIQDRSREGRHTCIFLSGTTRALLTEEFDLELFGNEDFKGKSEPVEVWEVRS